MKQTLLVIPREWFTSWILWLWLAVAIGWLIWKSRSSSWAQTARDYLPTFLIVTAIVGWVLPALSVPQVNPTDPLGNMIPGGLAIRGYGLFLMLAIVSSLGLVVLRCRMLGQNPEPYLTVCFVMIISGLIGARTLYVVQKWPEFADRDFATTLRSIVDMTKGGLVVYGSLIGGLLGALVYLRHAKLKFLPTLDILAPAMVWGLAIGRIGCLMNGCCYGGACNEDFPLGLRFPAGSPPFYEQYADGSLFGIDTRALPDGSKYPREVLHVNAGSLGEQFGLKVGESIRIPNLIEPERFQYILNHKLQVPIPVLIESQQQGEILREFSVADFPGRSLKVHPTQVYASISAALISGLLWFFYPLRRFDGQVLAMLLIAYAISRYFEEAIRIDEKGQLGTSLSISQWISFGVLAVGACVWIVGQRSNSPQKRR